jgi:hypothetical protein
MSVNLDDIATRFIFLKYFSNNWAAANGDISPFAPLLVDSNRFCIIVYKVPFNCSLIAFKSELFQAFSLK